MKTVPIKPVKAYVNGKQMEATQFNLVSISDNLFDHVIFKYTLLDADGTWAGEATYELVGETDYKKWDATPAGAYQIVASGIGLEIVQVKESLFTEVA